VSSTSKTGEITQAKVLAALVESGRSVLLPFGDHKRYDMVVEEPEGCFLRVQCKTGWVSHGAIWFATASVDSRSIPGSVRRQGYRGQIELFGVYCPATHQVYLGRLTTCRLARRRSG